MANSLATVTYSMQYIDADGKSVTPSSIATSCPYTSQTIGTLDVPDLTASATAFNIPLGGVTNAFLIVVINKTGQELSVKVNGGSAVTYQLPDKGTYVAQALSDHLATPLVTSLSVTTTATQAGLGIVEYKVFGDPS
jgi:hypothetical protein